MTETQLRALLERTVASVTPRRDVLAAAVAEGRRRRRRRLIAASTMGVFAATTVLGGAAAVLSPPERDPGRNVDVADATWTTPHARRPVAARPSPSATPDNSPLATRLGSLLEGRGAVTVHGDWLPWGGKAGPDEPVLADGTPGHGGEVMLDGKPVWVLIGPRQGPECGYRTGAESNCQPVPGGFVQTGSNEAEHGGSEGHFAAYYTADLAISVHAAEGVLDVASLIRLAQDPVWLERP